MDRKGFCVLPFSTLYVENNRVRLCCESEERVENILDSTTGVMDIWNNSFYQSIRNEMLSGNLPDACRICKMNEDIGVESSRQWKNSKHQNISQYTSSISNSPINFDVRPSNKCNLECVMCNGVVSSAISDRIKTYNGELPIETGEYWNESELIANYVRQNSNDVVELNFAGGEPFLMKEVLDLLTDLVNDGSSKNISLTFLTNGTVVRQKWFKELLTTFKKVKLNISIDGIGDTLEYVRYPSKWKTINSNIIFLKQLSMKYPNVEVSLSPVLHLLNALELHRLFSYAAINSINISLGFVYQSSNEEYLHTNLLTKELRQRVSDNFQRVQDSFPEMDWNTGHEHISNLVNQEYSTDTKQIEYLRRVTKYWDSHRDVKFSKQYPYLDYIFVDK